MFERREGCLTCHQAYTTLHVPGMLERSVYVSKEGLAFGQWGSFDPDDRSPFRQRWGGWYVTGAHGPMRHMGNAIITDPTNRDAVMTERALDRSTVDDLFDTKGYLASTSDIAALMVFLHQGRAMNLLTRIGWEARIAAQSGNSTWPAVHCTTESGSSWTTSCSSTSSRCPPRSKARPDSPRRSPGSDQPTTAAVRCVSSISNIACSGIRAAT